MVRQLQKFLLSWFITLPAAVCFCQVGHLRFNNFGTREGLSDKQVRNVVQGADGFLWIGTSNGLNRFDGKQFKIYKPKTGHSTSLPAEDCTPVFSMENGDIWVSTVKGLAIYHAKHQQFERMLHHPGDKTSAPSNPIWMMQDSRKRYWLGGSQGWCQYHPENKTFTFYKYEQLEKDYTISIRGMTTEAMLEWVDGTFWVVSNYGLYHFNPDNKRTERYLYENGKPSKEVSNLFTSAQIDKKNGNIWMGTWAGGLVCFNIHSKKFSQYFFSNNQSYLSNHNIATDILYKSENEYWIASPDAGFGIFNTQTKQFSFFKPETLLPGNLPANNVLYLAKDWQDNLWISTGMGLYSLNSRSRASTWHEVPNMRKTDPYHRTRAFIKDTAAKKLLIGIEIDEGIYSYDYEQDRYEKIIWKECLKNKNHPFITLHMMQDSRGIIWLTGYTGIYQYQPERKQIIKESILSGEIFDHTHGTRMMEDSEGYLWITSRWNGCYRYHPVTKKLDHYSMHATGPVVLRSNRVSDIKEHAPGVMLILAPDIGPYLLDIKEKRTKDIVPKDHLKDLVSFQEMAKGKDGSYWIGTAYTGLIRLQPSGDSFVVKRYFNGDDHPGLKIKNMALAENDLLWLGSEKGLIVMNTHTGKDRYFNSLDGLIDDDIWQEIYIAPDGEVYIGRENGFIHIKPQNLLSRGKTPPIYFTSIKVAGEEWIDSIRHEGDVSKFELDYNQNMLDISFAALNFSNPQENRYSYKLEGLEEKWISTGNRSQVNLIGMPPGNYTLYIKAESTDGSWQTQPAMIILSILPPFYKTWWFIGITCSIVAIVVWLLHLFRIKQIREKEQLKTSLQKEIAKVEMKALRAQMNPHFIFNCLNSINGFIARNEQKEASHYLARFAKLIRLILENAQHEFISLESEISTLSIYLEIEAVRFEKKFTYAIEVDDTLHTTGLQIPSMVIQPYLENAIWHGLMHQQKPGRLVVSFQPAPNNLLKVMIEDNGVGRDKAAIFNSKNELKNKSFGMKITGERIRLLNEIQASDASLQIEDLYETSGTPAGTRVTLLLPIKFINTDL